MNWVLLFLLLLSPDGEPSEVIAPPGGLELGKPFYLLVETESLGPDFHLLGPAPESLGLEAGTMEVLPLRAGTFTLPGGTRIRVQEPARAAAGEPLVPDLLRPMPGNNGIGGWILLIALVLVGVGFLGWKRFRGRDRPSVVKPLDGESFLQSLPSLENSNLAAAAWYEELSRVLRCFLAFRFGLKALAWTSEEIGAAFDHEGTLPVDQAHDLLALLEGSDLAKFAGREPDHEKRQNDLAFAIRFVKSLTPPGEGANR